MPVPVLPFASPGLAGRLAEHAARFTDPGSVRPLLADPDRFRRLAVEAEGLFVDLSRQRLDPAVLTDLLALAEASGVRAAIEAMFRGEVVNGTESRPALHVALRDPGGEALRVGGEDVRAAVAQERARCRDFVRTVRDGDRRGSTGQAFTDVVNIGIGGSDLGPVMAVEALRSYAQPGLGVHFVSNIDGTQLADLLPRLTPARTLFVICSKTFTTIETLTNARAARHWIAAGLGEAAVPRHFAAVSVNHAEMNAFGVAEDARFGMWDWVGGRYSMWSAIGLSIELAIGSANFEAMLGGAHLVDAHFRSAPLERNLPVLLGVVGVWNRNFLDCASHAILPYDQRLHRLPAYLQQLAMESNGKRVRRDGRATAWDTEPVLWGEPGSNGQHSFFQLLHQGTARVSLDLLLPARSSVARRDAHDLAIANCLAQAEAFARGYSLEDATRDLAGAASTASRAGALAPHKVHPGGRPVTILAFERLDPSTLGKLVALYEHKVFVASVIWDINPFDQWGVELGKKLALQLAAAVRGEERLHDRLELQALIDRLLQWRGE